MILRFEEKDDFKTHVERFLAHMENEDPEWAQFHAPIWARCRAPQTKHHARPHVSRLTSVLWLNWTAYSIRVWAILAPGSSLQSGGFGNSFVRNHGGVPPIRDPLELHASRLRRSFGRSEFKKKLN